MKNKPHPNSWQLLVLLLKDVADQKGITQEAIATAVGCHRQAIVRLFAARYKPNLQFFLDVANAVGVNFFFEDTDGTSDLNQAFEKAMEQMGRRPDKLPNN